METELNSGGDLSAEDMAYFDNGGVVVEEAPKVEDTGTATDEAGEKLAETTVQDDAGKTKTVPHQALHAEREEHKKTKQELSELREYRIRNDERWAMLMQRMQQPSAEKQEPEYPDANNDPQGALDWIVNQFRTRDQRDAEARASQERETEQATYQRQVSDFVDGKYAEAVQSDPEVQEAFQRAFDSYSQEFEAIGYRGQALTQAVQQQLAHFQMIAAQQIQRGVSIGDFVKSVARTRGWAPKAQSDPVGEAVQKGNEKLDAREKAMNAAKSLSSAAGGASAQLTAEDIDAMDDAEFASWLEKSGDAAWRRLNGG